MTEPKTIKLRKYKHDYYQKNKKRLDKKYYERSKTFNVPFWFKSYTHYHKNKLTKAIKPKDKIIFTTYGVFKRRKNGRIILKIGDEIVRCVKYEYKP